MVIIYSMHRINLRCLGLHLNMSDVKQNAQLLWGKTPI